MWNRTPPPTIEGIAAGPTCLTIAGQPGLLSEEQAPLKRGEHMKTPHRSFLGELFNLSTFVFGWSFVWRWFLLVQLPYIFVLGVRKIAGNNLTDTNVTIIVVMYVGFVVWAAFAHGQILRRIQVRFSVQDQVSASRFFVGAKMLLAVILCSLVWVIPAIALNFVASFVVGAVLGFIDVDPQAITHFGQAAGYAVNAVASIFLFGYLAMRILSAQLRAEGKTLVIPARSLFGAFHTQETAPAV